jgi:hypothetical protein
MSKPTLNRERAGRYKVDDDDESASLALVRIFERSFVFLCSSQALTSMLGQAVMGPPAICVVFEVPDEDEAQPEDISDQKEELKMVRSSRIHTY